MGSMSHSHEQPGGAIAKDETALHLVDLHGVKPLSAKMLSALHLTLTQT